MINLFGTIIPPPPKEREADLAERVYMRFAGFHPNDVLDARRYKGGIIDRLRNSMEAEGITEKPMGEVVFDGWANAYENNDLFLHDTKYIAGIQLFKPKGRTIRVRVYDVPEVAP